ncbi:pyruvate dehydrogenase complex dihydrolipoamide acetyltransferase [Gaopeijia maritima]|uniref:pyruvate dehydrogenase complex dihydrolipoamide acetyltransferase n=1 Tax=Gaopeijia maritima TaxID=3119007 RepID=UPI00324AE1AA
MATKVHMEALSPTMEEGQLVKWLKGEGDEVSSGDVLAEIETDKATMELVARGDGVLRAILLAEGGTAAVGEVIGVIAGADEDISALVGEGGGSGGGGAADDAADAPAAEKDDADADPVADEAASAPSEAAAPSSDEAASTEPSGRVKASPLARRLAEDTGVDLASIEGSGPGGRIVKRDVEAARSAPAAAPAPAASKSAPAPADWSDAGAQESYDEVPVSQMRKAIARRLTESISPVPHFFLTVDVDMTRAVAARKQVNALVEAEGDRVSFNDFVLKAAAAALVRHPDCNAAWHGDHIKRFHHVHMGVAVAIDDGLITPVVKHADRKGLVQISREVKEMAGRARQKRLKPDEYTGATFSVSNLGAFGIHEFTAIINPPEAGILAVGRIEDTPVAIGGEVVVRPRMRITMSCDHRVIDGAQGARFLQTLQAMLEEPAAILV